MLYKLAEGISIFLTSPTIWLGIGILHLWGPSAVRTWRKKPELRDPSEWLILGIAVAFLGSVADNGYWGVVWSASFSDAASFFDMVHLGPTVNIFVRQLTGIYAAHCHIMAYLRIRNKESIRVRYRAVIIISLIIGLLWILFLTIVMLKNNC